MPTFNSYWLRLSALNPGLLDDDSRMSLTVDSFREAMQKAYNQGGADRARDEKATEPHRGSSLFESIFGNLVK